MKTLTTQDFKIGQQVRSLTLDSGAPYDALGMVTGFDNRIPPRTIKVRWDNGYFTYSRPQDLFNETTGN